MIKKTFRGIGRILKPLVNFSAWMNLNSLKENNHKLGKLAKAVLMPEQLETKRETFEHAVARLGLDEKALQARQLYFKRLATLYLSFAVLLFLYALYLLLIVGTLLGFIMTLVAIWITLALAFKQHFWYTQMKVRRLGLSFKEWFLITFHTTRGMGT